MTLIVNMSGHYSLSVRLGTLYLFGLQRIVEFK